MFGRCCRDQEEFYCPASVAIDDNDMVYVSEPACCLVSVFTSEGQLVTSFGRRGRGPGEFDYPCGLAVDDSGVVYVCDNRIQMF
jgi:DNA-binding beta-propeller fold protein YncE